MRAFAHRGRRTPTLWASLYETFLLVDADTIVWGDMRTLADFDRFDFIVDSPGIEPVRTVMDVDQASACSPDFVS